MPCPRCDGEMELIDIWPSDECRDKYVYECVSCGFRDTVIVRHEPITYDLLECGE